MGEGENKAKECEASGEASKGSATKEEEANGRRRASAMIAEEEIDGHARPLGRAQGGWGEGEEVKVGGGRQCLLGASHLPARFKCELSSEFISSIGLFLLCPATNSERAES